MTYTKAYNVSDLVEMGVDIAGKFMYELVQQLRGQAGKRQVPEARVGLAHCMGGFLHGDGGNSYVHILTR